MAVAVSVDGAAEVVAVPVDDDAEGVSALDSQRPHTLLMLPRCTPDSLSKASSIPCSITASFDSLVINPAFVIKHWPIFSPGAQVLQLVLTNFSTAPLNRRSSSGSADGIWEEEGGFVGVDLGPWLVVEGLPSAVATTVASEVGVSDG